ncbi:hypothetical protein [Nocardioides sp.]|uniref:hypothetical protein n=1 Tax=Nocardioides sp. TaxID=35761 RepID=UPI003265899B
MDDPDAGDVHEGRVSDGVIEHLGVGPGQVTARERPDFGRSYQTPYQGEQGTRHRCWRPSP